MKLRQYQIDAFTQRVFGGNPAAVCPLDAWLSDTLMQAVATENNLSETAFFVPQADGYHLRWFTPVSEIEMCGHATLAAAYVLFECLGYTGEKIRFATLSGELTVQRAGQELMMDFPARPPTDCVAPAALLAGLKATPAAVLAADDYIAVFADPEQVRTMQPEQAELARLDLRGVIVTAAGQGVDQDVDFISRFFGPKYGIPEDPATGSAHCALAPYWGKRLNKTSLLARQVSARGGELRCELRGERVLLYGQARKFMQGEIELPE